MADITPVVHYDGLSGVRVILWETLTSTNIQGAPYRAPHYADVTVQILGTLAGSDALIIEGSLIKGTTTDGDFTVLTDVHSNVLSGITTAAQIDSIAENVLEIRPRLSTAADGSTDVDVYMLFTTMARR